MMLLYSSGVHGITSLIVHYASSFISRSQITTTASQDRDCGSTGHKSGMVMRCEFCFYSCYQCVVLVIKFLVLPLLAHQV